MKWILLVGVSVPVVFVSGFISYHLLSTLPNLVQSPAGSHQPNVSAYQVAQTASLAKRERVAALGRLIPQSDIIEIGAPSNDRLSHLLVNEGQSVEQGEVLAYLESYAERLAERNYAESQLREAKTRLAAETAYGTASIEEAKIHTRQLQELHLLDSKVQEAKIRQLEADLAGAKKDLARFEGLRQKGAIAQQEVDHQSLQVQRTQEELHHDTAVLAKLHTTYDMHLLTAQAQLKTARAQLVRAQAAIQVDSLTKHLSLAQARLDRTILKAPISGKIIQILTRPGETVGLKPLLRIGNTQQMYAVAEVYETDIQLVHKGQRARVTSPALSEVLTGTVVNIGSTVSKNGILDLDPAISTDARVVEVKIRLHQSEMAARLINLQVNLFIDLHKTAEVMD